MTASLSNWRESPYNEWSFINVDKLVSTQPVKKPAQAESLDLGDRHALDHVKMQAGSNGPTGIEAFAKQSHTDGMVVLNRGRVIYEYYAHGNNSSSKHIMMSMTKSVVGILTGILSAKGFLDINGPVKTYVPSAGSVYDNVTIRQLLDMNSGVRYDDNSHAYRAAVGWNPLHGDESADNLHSFIEQFNVPTKGPGTGFSYSSVNTDLLGWALEEATGKKLADLISELIWQPMGAESDALLTVDKNGNARAAGGLCATLRDIARIGRLVSVGGPDVVPSSWIDDMLHSSDRALLPKDDFQKSFQGTFDSVAYRSCWTVDGEAEVLCALGIHGQVIMVDRARDIVLAKTSSEPSPMDYGSLHQVVKLFKRIQQALV